VAIAIAVAHHWASGFGVVLQARELALTFSHLRFEWIPGHAGIAESERCDVLARGAIQVARSSGVNTGERTAVVHR
jgi:ribonuclease HI